MPPKRSATDQPTDRASKRSSTTSSNDDPIPVEAIEQFEVTIGMHDNYLVYPADLRHALESQFKSTVQTQIFALTSGRPFKPRYSYILLQEDRERSAESSGREISTLKRDFPTASLANAALLDVEVAKMMVLTKPKFEHLKRQDKIANPENVRLHAVRNGEVGWGFDCNGCLSLYTVKREKGKLMEYAIYVRRLKAVKQEPDT